MSALVLRRLANGRWLLVLAPDAQRLEKGREGAELAREDVTEARRVPFFSPLPAAGGAR